MVWCARSVRCCGSVENGDGSGERQFFSYAGRAEAQGSTKHIDWRDALYLGKSAGLSFKELDEMTFADLLSYVGFLTENKDTAKHAGQADIDQLAI